jgi:hypothetical protein
MKGESNGDSRGVFSWKEIVEKVKKSFMVIFLSDFDKGIRRDNEKILGRS